MTTEKLYTIFKMVMIGIGCIILIVPFIIAVYYLQKQGKKLQLFPTIKVIEVINHDSPDLESLESGLNKLK